MSDIQPTIPNLPELRTRLTNKYTELAPVLPQLPPAVRNTLIDMDTTRVARGQNPLTGPQTVNAVGAAVTGRPITPAPERDDSFNPLNLIANFGRDVLAIGRSIPHLPGALIDEVRDLPNFAEIAAEDGLLNAPGIRLLPGAYTAASAQEGNLPSTIAQHPGFFLADVLPAGKALKNAPLPGGGTVGSAARALPPIAATENILRTAGRELSATRPGQFYQANFGRPGRAAAQAHAEAQRVYREAATGTTDLTNTIYADTPEASLVRRARELRETYSTIPPERQAELTRIAQLDDWQSARNTLPDLEASYLQSIRDGFDELAANEGRAGTLVNFKGEWYDRSTGNKLVKGQQQIDRATTLNTIRNYITDPPDLPTLTTTITDALSSDTLTRKMKRDALRGASFSLDAAGYNGQLLRDNLQLFSKSPDISLDSALTSFTDIESLGRNFGTVTTEQLVNFIAPHRSNPNIRLAIDNLRSGSFSRARENIQIALQSTTIPHRMRADLSVVPDQISAIGQREKFLRQTDQFNDKRTARTIARFERQQARTPPARFIPAIQEKIKQGVLERHATDPDFAAISDYIERGQYSISPEIQATAKQLANEFQGTWQQLKSQGHDPIFIAHVSPSATRNLDFPTLPLGPRTPSFVKKRNVLDSAPYDNNMSVALTHAAQEALGRIGAEHFVDQFTTMYGRRRYADFTTGTPGVEDLYRARAEAEALNNPTLNIDARTDDLINREFEVFDPSTLTPWRKARATSISAQDQILIPKPMARVLKDIYDPKTYAVQGIMDPVMKLFRNSVLALSPRWHFNNLFGNAGIIAFEDPRIFAQLPDAIRMLRGADITLPDGTTVNRARLARKGITGTGSGSLPAEILEWQKTSRLPPTSRIAQIQHQYAAGRTLRRIMDESGKVIDKSYAMNSWVDDMFRTMSYLHGYGQAVKSRSKRINLKSLLGDLAPDGTTATTTITREAAEQAGLNLTRKMFQTWDSMTPFERNVIRYVFPFYGWVSHITKYAMRYPIDHPIRVAVLSSVAGRELEDLQAQGLPDQFLNMFFLGGVGDDGKQRAISLGAMNPLSDVGNNFTLAGLTTQLNPVIGNFLQAIGIDPMSGQAELYPDLKYDSETGRFSLATSGGFGSVLGSVVPQAQLALSLFGANAKYNELAKTNPDSAINMLRSQAGLPVVFKNVPITQTQMTGEINRQRAQTTAFNEALKSGDLASLQQQYPTLAPMIDQIRAMDRSGQLDPFRIDTTTHQPQSTSSALMDALVKRNLPIDATPRLAGAYAIQDEMQREMPWTGP